MPERNRDFSLDMEKVKLERLKVYGKVVIVFLTVGLGTFGVAFINKTIQDRQLAQQDLVNEANLDLQQKKAEAELRQSEMKYLGDYLKFALEDDINRRLRFAEYFAALTTSDDLQRKWEAYRRKLEVYLEEAQEAQQELYLAQSEGNSKKIEELEYKIEKLQAKISPTKASAEKDNLYLNRDDDTRHLHPLFREKLQVLLQRLNAEGIPFRLFEGFRFPNRQKSLYDRGRSVPGNIVTTTKPWDSLHQYGLEADLVPFEDGHWIWSSAGVREKWWSRLAAVAKEVGLNVREWERHAVYLDGYSIKDLKQGHYPAGGDSHWTDNLSAAITSWQGIPSPPPLPSPEKSS
jgi:hypothetical protein